MSDNELDRLMMQADIANQEAREGGSVSSNPMLENENNVIRLGYSIDGGILEDILAILRKRGHEVLFLTVNQDAYGEGERPTEPYLELNYRKERA